MAQNSSDNQEINRLRAELRVQKALSSALYRRLAELTSSRSKAIAHPSGLRVINGGAS